jgi:hypothetical protein
MAGTAEMASPLGTKLNFKTTCAPYIRTIGVILEAALNRHLSRLQVKFLNSDSAVTFLEYAGNSRGGHIYHYYHLQANF